MSVSRSHQERTGKRGDGVGKIEASSVIVKHKRVSADPPEVSCGSRERRIGPTPSVGVIRGTDPQRERPVPVQICTEPPNIAVQVENQKGPRVVSTCCPPFLLPLTVYSYPDQ